jgi:hypothetical protein
MTKLHRLTPIGFMVLGILVLATTSSTQTRPPVVDKLANAYGLDSFAQVEAVRYTFNLQRPGSNVSRSWVWEPKTGKISYEGKNQAGKPVKVTFVQSELNPESPVVKNRIDWLFVNDNYWMFLPFHVYWDTPGADAQDKGMQKLPLARSSAQLVVIQYSKAGYTPGDTWDLYLGPDYRIQEMVYHRGDPKSTVPGLIKVTWAGYKKAGPLLFSTEHRGTADGKPVLLSFSVVAVKLVGSESWIDAH